MPEGDYGRMNINRRHAVAALIAAGLLWGTTVPLSKLALQWLSPGWLTVVRFGLAAGVLLVVARRRGRGQAQPPAQTAPAGGSSSRQGSDSSSPSSQNPAPPNSDNNCTIGSGGPAACPPHSGPVVPQ